MYRRELMILGLRRQNELLGDLIKKMSKQSMIADEQERDTYDFVTNQVAHNLRRLRHIHRAHRDYLDQSAS